MREPRHQFYDFETAEEAQACADELAEEFLHCSVWREDKRLRFFIEPGEQVLLTQRIAGFRTGWRARMQRVIVEAILSEPKSDGCNGGFALKTMRFALLQIAQMLGLETEALPILRLDPLELNYLSWTSLLPRAVMPVTDGDWKVLADSLVDAVRNRKGSGGGLADAVQLTALLNQRNEPVSYSEHDFTRGDAARLGLARQYDLIEAAVARGEDWGESEAVGDHPDADEAAEREAVLVAQQEQEQQQADMEAEAAAQGAMAAEAEYQMAVEADMEAEAAQAQGYDEY